MKDQITSKSSVSEITFGEALAAAAKHLPGKSSVGELLTLDIALRAAADLAEHNHPEDDQLLSLLWLFPNEIAGSRTPGSMKALISGVRKVWAGILSAIPGTHQAPEPFSTGDEPSVARVIAATYLRMVIQSGRAEALRLSVKPAPGKEVFYERLLAIAGALKEHSPDLSGELLLEAVKRAIRDEGLKQKLLPEEVRDAIWTFSLRPQVPRAEGDAAVRSLRCFLSGFWLSTAVSATDGRVEALYLLAEEGRGEAGKGAGEEGAAIERLAASIAVRFSKVFSVAKTQKKEDGIELSFHRAGISGWHMGLRLKGRHDQLLRSREADPLTEFVRMEPSCDLKAQLGQIGRLASI
ncbi:hypothetical protein [uncultured Sutterella sp.]|uniref:hypothetical protein n=1 Tax=uncultured Sutterella sp. TaxID=286133 RepID=UPI0026112CEF|nr:hypothetical protein [uncultured Sutterella sp.]